MSLLALVLAPLYALLMSLLASWLNRKLKARLQWRVGPPVFQPLADLLKLLAKEDVKPSTAHPLLYDLAPVMAFASALALSWLVPYGLSAPPLSSAGDLVLVMYLTTLLSASVIIGGFASGNPYSMAGSRRLTMLTVGVEIPLILALAAVGAASSSLSIADVVALQEAEGPLVSRCWLALVVLLLVYPAKTLMNPFTLPDAETEIVEGPLTEYSGRRLALLEVAHLVEKFLLLSLTVDLFLHLDLGIPLLNVAYNTLVTLALVAVYSLVEACTARIRVREALRAYMTLVNMLAVVSLAQGIAVSAGVM